VEAGNTFATGTRHLLWDKILMKHLAIIGLSVFSIHCAIPVELEFDSNFAEKVVIYAEFEPDSLWTVNLGRNVIYTDSINWNEYIITEATVTISADSEIKESLIHVGQGIFQSSHGSRPVPETQYTITVNTPALPEVSASSKIPAIQADFVKIQELSSDATMRSFRIHIRIVDQIGQDNYSLQIHHLEPICHNDGGIPPFMNRGETTIWRSVSFNSDFPEIRDNVPDINDPSSAQTGAVGGSYSEGFFTDRSFEGQSKMIELTINVPHYDVLPPYIQVSVTNWSHELWSYIEYQSVVDLFGPSYFEENPKFIYSNIQGGLGIFGGKNQEHLRFDHEGASWDLDEFQIGFELVQPCDSQ